MRTGFDLPQTNEATIKACLDIYERRFVSKESQPEPIAHNIVANRDVVVGQLSRILTPRILPDLEAGGRHPLLGKQATGILRSIGRELTDETLANQGFLLFFVKMKAVRNGRLFAFL